MKIAVLGAGGVRTPLLVRAMAGRREQLGLDTLALMDTDLERLEMIAALIAAFDRQGRWGLNVLRTTDLQGALDGADFVITTFRVGGAASRVVDERVPLSYGVLGQETTGPGGFAMAMRTIPVLLDDVARMRQLCPDAWLINFANPAGLLAEAAIRVGRWERTVGICDAPAGMARVAAALLGAAVDEVFLDYFGLNHLGWARAVLYDGRDYLPQFIQMVRQMGGMPGLPFDGRFVAALGMIPNEYLYYYYHAAEAVQNILLSGQTRGEQIVALNERLFADLSGLLAAGDSEGMVARYHAYLAERGETYMARETGGAHKPQVSQGNLPGLDPAALHAIANEGYAGVALDLIEALAGARPRVMILNVPNRGAIPAMGTDDVVEVPACVGKGMVRPLAVGQVPDHALGLMQQVKAYEQLTIAAAAEGSYSKALAALTVHPLVRDHGRARAILDGYCERHRGLFPRLT